MSGVNSGPGVESEYPLTFTKRIVFIIVVKRKNPAAVALGRRGGKARLKKMTAEERSRIARLAAQARWAKHKGKGESERKKQ